MARRTNVSASANSGRLLWRSRSPRHVQRTTVLSLPSMCAAAEHSFLASSWRRLDCSRLFGVVSELRSSAVPFAVGAYITAAYWFTASTSFANPAVTLARAATNTFSGIRPADVPGFIAAQLVGAFAATAVFRWLVPSLQSEATSVLVPHEETENREIWNLKYES